jgi:hypothetical protein
VNRRYRVHVVDEATIVAHGERVRVWFAPLNDGWVRAAEHPEALVENSYSERGDESCPPGTIWMRQVELTLPAGSVLLCRDSMPARERLEPIEYLKRGKLGMARSRRETKHRVIGNYRLELVAD